MTQRDDYDSPWKEILTDYFEQFMVFFFPDIALKIDWAKGYNSLDKELRQITREAETGGRLADKLFQVWQKNGEETWVLAHVEVQAQKKTDFQHRTFIYNYRSYDLYQRPVASLAVLADDNPKWRPSVYSHKIWGCRVALRFRTVKLLDYKKKLKSLEKSGNIFAVATAAHLRTMETKKDTQSRLRYKLELTKALYRQGFTKSDIINLYRFIDWIMVLPEELEDSYHRELFKYEEKYKMRYVTNAERIGLKRGETKMLLRQMEARFGTIPQWAKEKIEDADILAIEEWGIRVLSANSPEEVLK
ncbi:MAG: hypothetical protein GY795_42805 [Desulfobacterales bacterium]|nr:hypothetical protein [Desulfobacterales bacterium]